MDKTFGIALVAALMLGACTSADHTETLDAQAKRIDDLSAATAGLQARNDELEQQNQLLSSREREMRNRLDQSEKANTQLQALIEANARDRLAEKEKIRVDDMAKADASETDGPPAKTTEEPAKTTEAGTEPDKGTKPEVVEPAKKGPYHLRIISLPGDDFHAKKVQAIAKWLEAKGIKDVVARRSGEFWVIDIGNFTSIRTDEATALKKSIRAMKYEGREQFRSAYFAQY